MSTIVSSPHHIAFKALPPLSLYIHLPWCVRKCPYCDFNSHEASQTVPESAYVQALLQDLEFALPLIWGRKFHSVFFGGGTPSLFSAESIDQILCGVRTLVPLEHFAEITLEANPGTAESQKFKDFQAAGVNRLSVGIQSFDAQALQALGRIHDDKQARRAIEIAATHFDNINLDIMYALPGQSLGAAKADIQSAISYAPQHISAYHLTLEPNTLFYKNPPALPNDDTSAQMQSTIEDALAEAAYIHYETSAFSILNKQCRHNLNYWMFGDYLGIGAGAHSKITSRNSVMRQARHKHPAVFIEKVGKGEQVLTEQILTPADLGFEFMMNALRLNEGFPVSLFQDRTGLPLKQVERPLTEAEEKRLVTWDALTIRPTELGRKFLNDLLQLFLKD